MWRTRKPSSSANCKCLRPQSEHPLKGSTRKRTALLYIDIIQLFLYDKLLLRKYMKSDLGFMYKAEIIMGRYRPKLNVPAYFIRGLPIPNLIETRWVVFETKHWDHRRKDIYPFHALILCTLCKEWSEGLETMNVLQSVELKSQICYRRTGSSGSTSIKNYDIGVSPEHPSTQRIHTFLY
jgi:hypothetical protein